VTTPTVIYSTASARSRCAGTTIGDGRCNAANNNAQCSYDGGDCCASTCVSGAYTCGSAAYNCISPGAPAPQQAAPTPVPTLVPTFAPTTLAAAKNPTVYPSSYPSSHPTLGPVKQVPATGWMQILSFSVRPSARLVERE
jgi:hypothetical protein